MLGQGSRARAGAAALAGNHLVLELDDGRGYVRLAHLRERSMQVGLGEVVVDGQELAACGNSGNSTQPHLHIQVMDGVDASRAWGMPMTFWRYRNWSRDGGPASLVAEGVPGESQVVDTQEEDSGTTRETG